MAEPPITVRARYDSGPGNTPVTRVVIHATVGGGFPGASRAGMARSVANYFTTAAAGGSAHYIVDVASEEHCVPDNVIAWHAPPNDGSIGIEICSEPTYTREQWLDPAVWPAVQRAATRCREVCDRYSLPRTWLSSADLLAGRHGVTSHNNVSQAWHQTDHWDPGPGFPVPEFMAAVGGSSPGGGFLMALNDDEQRRVLKAGEDLVWLVTQMKGEVDETHGWLRGGDPKKDNITLLWEMLKGQNPGTQNNFNWLHDEIAKMLAGAMKQADPQTVAAALAPLLAKLLPAGGAVSQADLEAALRNVLGSLDNTKP